MMEFVAHCFALQMSHNVSIDVFSHFDIFSKDWEVLNDFVVNCMYDLLQWLSGDVMKLSCAITPLYIKGGVLFLLLPRLWNERA